jgi:hypothetical protein
VLVGGAWQATEECRNVCHVVRLKRNKEVLDCLLHSKHLLQYRFQCDEVLFAYERLQSDALEWSEMAQVGHGGRAEREPMETERERVE